MPSVSAPNPNPTTPPVVNRSISPKTITIVLVALAALSLAAAVSTYFIAVPFAAKVGAIGLATVSTVASLVRILRPTANPAESSEKKLSPDATSKEEPSGATGSRARGSKGTALKGRTPELALLRSAALSGPAASGAAVPRALTSAAAARAAAPLRAQVEGAQVEGTAGLNLEEDSSSVVEGSEEDRLDHEALETKSSAATPSGRTLLDSLLGRA